MPAWAGSVDMADTYRQQRSHFDARRAADGDAQFDFASCGVLARSMTTSETMNSMGSCFSYRCSRAKSSPDAVMWTLASSDVPICLSFLSNSSDPLTAVRIRSSCSHVSSRLRSTSGSISPQEGRAQGAPTLRVSQEIAPQFFHRERQDRREQARQSVGHHKHGGLRRSPFLRASGECVQPVLGDVGIKRAEVDSDERVHRLEDRAVIVGLVSAQDLPREVPVSREDVPIDFLHVRRRSTASLAGSKSYRFERR